MAPGPGDYGSLGVCHGGGDRLDRDFRNGPAQSWTTEVTGWGDSSDGAVESPSWDLHTLREAAFTPRTPTQDL